MDDEEDSREMLRTWLELNDISVSTASGGQEALERLKRWPRPALIVLDLMMPEVDGRAVLRALRADEELASIPVVVASAHHRLDVGGLEDLPRDRFFQKPFKLDAVLATVQQILSASSPLSEDRWRPL